MVVCVEREHVNIQSIVCAVVKHKIDQPMKTTHILHAWFVVSDWSRSFYPFSRL
jgi:hypothetical protein